MSGMLNWIKSLMGGPAIAAPPSSTPIPESEEPTALQEIFIATLREEGYPCRMQKGDIVLESGLAASVEYLETQTINDACVRTTSRVTCRHALHFPEGIFEFQHASGASEVESLCDGFRTWAQTDLATLCDALSDETQSSLRMEMSIPAKDGRPERKRKLFMGPYLHTVARPAVEPGACGDGCHEFCPCCLFTNSIDAFRALLESPGFVGIRLYACRDEDGAVAADCRVNGEDYALGVEHLKKYAATWPARGFEIRKQYVTIRNAD